MKMKPLSDKGMYRDFSWNSVLWSSSNTRIKISNKFGKKTQTISRGTIEIYPQATADVLFGAAEIVSAGFSNSYGRCVNKTTRGYFDRASKSFVLSTELCPNGFCDDNQLPEDMYCPNLFQPLQFGYNERKSPSPSLDISIDSRTLTTALAVNLGILSISDLSVVSRDDQFDRLLEALVKRKFLSADLL
jgi:hypothetical protein